MGVLDRYGGAALKYWPEILGSAYAHSNVSGMWDKIRGAQQRYGLEKPGVTGPDVMTLRGYANRIVNGAKALGAAGENDVITADMMAIAPYTANTREGIAANPTYHVRFRNTVQGEDGTVSTVWQTAVFTRLDWPNTVGELMTSITNTATELAAQSSGRNTNTPKGVSLFTTDHEITVL